MKRALIVVDVQNDFCEGGSLPVAGGAEVATRIGGLLTNWLDTGVGYQHVVATQDHHRAPGAHWSDEPDYATSWPRHCAADTPGAEFHPNLSPRPFDAVFRKGEHAAAYSGFEGTDGHGTTLGDWLRQRQITHVDVCGLATDYCVKATALDAARAGLTTRVLGDFSAGVAPETTESAIAALQDAGVTYV